MPSSDWKGGSAAARPSTSGPAHYRPDPASSVDARTHNALGLSDLVILVRWCDVGLTKLLRKRRLCQQDYQSQYQTSPCAIVFSQQSPHFISFICTVFPEFPISAQQWIQPTASNGVAARANGVGCVLVHMAPPQTAPLSRACAPAAAPAGSSYHAPAIKIIFAVEEIGRGKSFRSPHIRNIGPAVTPAKHQRVNGQRYRLHQRNQDGVNLQQRCRGWGGQMLIAELFVVRADQAPRCVRRKKSPSAHSFRANAKLDLHFFVRYFTALAISQYGAHCRCIQERAVPQHKSRICPARAAGWQMDVPLFSFAVVLPLLPGTTMAYLRWLF